MLRFRRFDAPEAGQWLPVAHKLRPIPSNFNVGRCRHRGRAADVAMPGVPAVGLGRPGKHQLDACFGSQHHDSPGAAVKGIEADEKAAGELTSRSLCQIGEIGS